MSDQGCRAGAGSLRLRLETSSADQSSAFSIKRFPLYLRGRVFVALLTHRNGSVMVYLGICFQV